MGKNQFGSLFKIVTWGESHGKAMGVVIDGCPAGLELCEEEIHEELVRRRPGFSPYTSPRKEPDLAEILSGVFEGKTTGAPLSIVIWNRDVDSSSYELLKEVYRPGHANFTYLYKYGVYDWRGGGRASARETVSRVAAGAVAKKLLRRYGIEVSAFVQAVGGVTQERPSDITAISDAMRGKLDEVMREGDSIGGVVELASTPLPIGLGEPVFDKLEARLGAAMLSIPGSKGVELGCGFTAASMRGSEHNDAFEVDKKGKVRLRTNHAGGTLGGISCGTSLHMRVAFKPTSSIKKKQQTVTLDGKETIIELPENARHDPCIALRAPAVVEAMAALTLVDFLLIQQVAKVNSF